MCTPVLLVIMQTTASYSLQSSSFQVVSDSVKGSNYVDSFISGTQDVNKTPLCATVSDKNSWDTLTKCCFFSFSCSPCPSQSCLSRFGHQILYTNIEGTRRPQSVPTILTETVFQGTSSQDPNQVGNPFVLYSVFTTTAKDITE